MTQTSHEGTNASAVITELRRLGDFAEPLTSSERGRQGVLHCTLPHDAQDGKAVMSTDGLLPRGSTDATGSSSCMRREVNSLQRVFVVGGPCFL